jgi:uncharacterized protein YukE
MSLRVDIEGLLVAGVSVTDHGEDLAVALASAADCIVAALPGWQGQSAAALTAAAENWSRASRALLTRLGEHADALHISAAQCQTQDQHGAQALSPP